MIVNLSGDKTVPVLPTPNLPEHSRPRCEDEPIRVPGSIQRHGFFLLLDETDRFVVAASDNVEEFTGVPLLLILGASIDAFFERELLGAFRGLSRVARRARLLQYVGAYQARGQMYNVITHLVGNQRVVEFEFLERLVSPELNNQVVTNFINKFGQMRTELELCEALTRQVLSLTQFNRVMLYRFDEAGHGMVLAEASDGTLPSYLGLQFPASDIPSQARELYLLNTMRIIPDASYTPSSLHGAEGTNMAGFDLSMSVLRSVSPVHLEYMRNMGTLSSMSVSIICDGKLWGLVSGHHATPHNVPYLVRSACDLLAKLVATQISSFRSSAALRKMVSFHETQRTILTHMAAENNYLLAMSDKMDEIRHITDAFGVALVIDGQCQTFGSTPQALDIKRLALWLDEDPDLEVFSSRNLASEIPWASSFSHSASGLLGVRISNVRQSYILWFYPELVQTIRWAGKDSKEFITGSLHPRASFDIWKKNVRGTSKRWSDMEIESVTDFRSAVMTISLKRAEEALQLGEARFLELTHALPNPVWTADDSGILTYVNQKWHEQGLSHEGHWFEQESMTLEDQQRCGILWRASVALGQAFDMEVLCGRTATHNERWFLVRAVPYLRARGTRAGWVGTCTDLTELRHREAAIQMTEKLALTGRMTSVIAHEINNPLEAITNLLYLLGDSVKDDAVGRNYIALAESELQRISGITKQTLRWAKETTQKPEIGSANALFFDSVKLLAGKIRNREVSVVIDQSNDAPYFGVVTQIAQVVVNLLSNAVQAVPVGGCVWLGSHRDGGMTELIVRDEGHGMSEETLGNLFRPFYSTKGDLGNGLGLYISQEIVHRHGGLLNVQSTLGVGTKITVRLPAAAALASLKLASTTIN